MAYTVTDKKLIINYTWFSREAKGKIYSKLSNVNLKQRLAGRFLGCGTLIPTVVDMDSFGVRLAPGMPMLTSFPIHPILNIGSYASGIPAQLRS